MPRRAMIYVDGFNLYYGLKDTGNRRHYWLDILALGSQIIKKQDVSLAGVKYFTSRIDGAHKTDRGAYAVEKDEKRQRQTIFLDALNSIDGIQIIEGKFLTSDVECRKCKASVRKPQEKMTDVNIATQLLLDAFHDKFDVAYVVSGDSDLSPPITAVRTHFSDKTVFVAFPPNRFSHELSTVASAYFRINETMLRASHLPEKITLTSGVVLRRPERWS